MSNTPTVSFSNEGVKHVVITYVEDHTFYTHSITEDRVASKTVIRYTPLSTENLVRLKKELKDTGRASSRFAKGVFMRTGDSLNPTFTHLPKVLINFDMDEIQNMFNN